MTEEEYLWHWWEMNKELKRLLRREIVVARALRNLEAKMLERGIEKPRSKPKLEGF
jgi:hypothetical protein